MAAKSCNVNITTCSLVSPSVLVQDKASRNKRKYRADPPLSEINGVISLPQNDCSVYEFSAEKFEVPSIPLQSSAAFDLCKVHQDTNTCDGLKLDLGFPCTLAKEEGIEADEFEDADWSDLTETQLEELALSNLDTIFRSAIKKIVAFGYTEEIAVKAILRSGLCYGSKDMLTNIVDNTLSFLRNIPTLDPLRVENHFGDLQQLEKYILAEMVCVLREVRPFFSIGDAMWCLLICDMNVSHACAMDSESLSGFLSNGSSNGNSDAKGSELSIVDGSAPIPAIPCSSAPDSCSTLSGLDKGNTKLTLETLKKSFSVSGTSQAHDVSEKTKKGISSISKREYILRQKSLHLGKTSQAHLCKGSSRKHSSLSSSLLEKKTKPGSDSVNLKNGLLKIHSKKIGVDLSQNSDTDLSLSLATKSSSKSVPVGEGPNCNFGVPFEMSADQWFPQDKKDERILSLIPRVHELQNQLQEWTEWANQKVMQAARRLSKDKSELKMLRQEKEEVERLKKEKQTLEESTLKKLAEMENALYKASGQVERANSAVRRLEVENVCLRRQMETAKVHAAESAANYHEVSKREKKTVSKFQTWEKQKKMFQDELKSEKVKLVKLLHEVEQVRNLRDQIQARWKQEEKAKEDVISEGKSIRKGREEAEACAKIKEETIRAEAETEIYRFKSQIHTLEREISNLRLKADSWKIAALKKGADGSYTTNRGVGGPTEKKKKKRNCRGVKESLTVPPTTPTSIPKKKKKKEEGVGDLMIVGSAGVKRERECVMCLCEETCVVFLPCGHQVVCRNCNELHEKQGMKDCPSCRSLIQRRITVRYVPCC